MKEESKNMTRRSFIGTTGAVAAGLTIIPGSVLSGMGRRAPGDKLNIAVVGIGGMGNSNLRAVAPTENIVALGDVDWAFEVGAFAEYWPTEWLRAGMVTQRTRVYQTDRDIQRGVLVGFAFKKLDGTVYFFNPGADDHFTVVSLGVSF